MVPAQFVRLYNSIPFHKNKLECDLERVTSFNSGRTVLPKPAECTAGFYLIHLCDCYEYVNIISMQWNKLKHN
jgi:hypothetical protein